MRGKNPKSLANLKPVKPGEVRNPLGVNRKRPYSDRYYAQSEELLSASEDGREILRLLKLPETATWADAAVRRLMREALKGNIAAIREMADRIEGKPPQRLEITARPAKVETTIVIKHEDRYGKLYNSNREMYEGQKKEEEARKQSP
jgi:hypothetical protein